MNREIRFRAWDKERKYFRTFSLNDPDWYDQEGDEVRNGCVEKWDQFTGLKDKNGKEIYEGDIVNEYGFFAHGIVTYGEYILPNFSNHDRQKKHFGWYVKPIHFYDGIKQITWNDSIRSLAHTTNGLGYEVIGNIYEDKHLLNKEEKKKMKEEQIKFKCICGETETEETIDHSTEENLVGNATCSKCGKRYSKYYSLTEFKEE